MPLNNTKHKAKQATDFVPNFIPLAKCYAPPKASRLRRLLYFLARRSYGRWLQNSYRVRHVNTDFLRELKAPYVLLANHVSNDDPFIYNILCPYPIAWIVGKSIERDSKFPRLCSFMLNTIRCIRRSKEMGDLDTIQHIHQWINDGEVVGIFPEGQTCLTGVSLHISQATAKLLRFLKVPVVAIRNEGGYFARPRWAQTCRCSRSGKGLGITLHYELLFDQEQIQKAKLGEINAKLQHALYYNPYQLPVLSSEQTIASTQVPPQSSSEAKPQPFAPATTPLLDKGLHLQNLAEIMELIFYLCLACRSANSLGAMQSYGMDLYCLACCARWRVSEDGHCVESQQGNYNIHLCKTSSYTDWHEEKVQHTYNLEQYYQAQLELLHELTASQKLHLEQEFAHLRCYTDTDLRAHSRYSGVSIELNTAGLRLQQKSRMLYHWPIKQIFASHVFKYNTWEFRAPISSVPQRAGKGAVHSKPTQESVQDSPQTAWAQFVLDFPQKNDSAFLWLDSLKILQTQEAPTNHSKDTENE